MKNFFGGRTMRVILFLLISTAYLLGDSVLLLKEGWQLIGTGNTITDMAQFEEEDVEQIWHYDASTQQWFGYSPDASIQNKMTDKGIQPIQALQSHHGFWIKSKRDWTLHLPDTEPASSQQDILSLKKRLEPHLFKR